MPLITITEFIILVIFTAAVSVNLSALTEANKLYSVNLPIPTVLKYSNPAILENEDAGMMGQFEIIE
ncbi:MAG: hypothetical protein J7K04_11975 [Spirochaetales bacterium]|nr:hypothetical protein [Spirochaetales bacterium]